MELQEIEVVIGKDGQVQIQVRGVNGPKCLDLTRALEDALGGEIISREMKPEALNEDPAQIDRDQQQTAGH